MVHSSFARDALKPRQPRGMRKGLGLALIVHVGLLIAIAIGVSWRSRTPDAVQAELWAAVPRSAAPRAAEPEPTPAPPPPPPPKPAPKVEEAPPPPKPLPDPQIAIEKAKQEKEKARKLEEERERKREEQEAQREKQEAQRKKQEADKRKEEAEAKKRAEQDAAKLAELRKKNLERMMGQAGASGEPRSTGTAQQSAGPSSSYAGLIRSHVKPKIVFSDTLPGNPAAEVEVRAGPDGTVLSRRLTRSSGSKEWDEAVIRAIDRAGALPRDIDGRVPPALIITFRPND